MSASTGITISSDYAFVAAAIASTSFLNLWQQTRVSKARKEAKIPYPQLYAEKSEAAASPAAYKFNCVQRAHQNTLEVQVIAIAGAAVTGLIYPRFAGALLAWWILGRVVYTIGYSSGKPHNREAGAIMSAMSTIPLSFASVWTAFQLFKAAS